MKLWIIAGTRPEVIKLAPVVHEAKKRGHQVQMIFSGQHTELALPLFKFFKIQIDHFIPPLEKSRSLTTFSSHLFFHLERLSSKTLDSKNRPDAVLVQGDTTTALMSGIWAFHQKIPLIHVEAGLRTYDLEAPFPEEGYRQMVSRIATVHYAPTDEAVKNLKNECAQGKIIKVGNTSIDTLLNTVQELKKSRRSYLNAEISSFIKNSPFVLVTSHRREAFGKKFAQICRGIRDFVDSSPGIRVVFPLHPNPALIEGVDQYLRNHPQILMTSPQDYPQFVELMMRSEFILTDSGGIQEEAPSLKKQILVLRDVTERPEGVRAGFAKLVGSNSKKIKTSALSLLKNKKTVKKKNPYGDGRASVRIIRSLESILGKT